MLSFTLFGAPWLAQALHDDDPRTNNIHPLGHNIVEADFVGLRTGNPGIHTDLAFQGKIAYQDSREGFRILNIAAPGNPKLVSFTDCAGNQGDVSSFDNILVRSWNSPAGPDATCDGQDVAADFEGIHGFDVSDLEDPVVVASVPILEGSHTRTLAPDTDNSRLLIYNGTSGGAAGETAIIEIPLDDPAGAIRLDRLNPQTQTFRIQSKGK